MSTQPLSPMVDLINAQRYTAKDALAPTFPDKTLDELWAMRREVEGFIAAAKSVLKGCDASIAELLGEGSSVRLDDCLVRYKQSRKLKVYNPDGLWDFLGLDARECFNVNSVRVTSLKAVAEKRGKSPDAVVNSFIDHELGDPCVEVIPESKAPKYMKSMKHGEIRRKAVKA